MGTPLTLAGLPSVDPIFVPFHVFGGVYTSPAVQVEGTANRAAAKTSAAAASRLSVFTFLSADFSRDSPDGLRPIPARRDGRPFRRFYSAL